MDSSSSTTTSEKDTAECSSRVNSKEINGSKSGWYFGKYFGKNKPDKPPEDNLQDPQCDELEGSKQDLEDLKQEAMIVRTVRSIRAKYLQRQLVGRIYIYRISGVIATAITSDVTADDIMNNLLKKAQSNTIMEDDLLMQAELDGKYKRALSTTDTILNSLERRSLNWDGCEFSHTTLLTRGTTVGVSDPIIGLIAFSFTVELSATVHTLLASRKRYEATRELAMCSLRNSNVEEESNDENTKQESDTSVA